MSTQSLYIVEATMGHVFADEVLQPVFHSTVPAKAIKAAQCHHKANLKRLKAWGTYKVAVVETKMNTLNADKTVIWSISPTGTFDGLSEHTVIHPEPANAHGEQEAEHIANLNASAA